MLHAENVFTEINLVAICVIYRRNGDEKTRKQFRTEW